MSGNSSLFNVGDMVIIRGNLSYPTYYANGKEEYKTYNYHLGISIDSGGSMKAYGGKKATIKRVSRWRVNNSIWIYSLDIDNGRWTWTEAMFMQKVIDNSHFTFNQVKRGEI